MKFKALEFVQNSTELHQLILLFLTVICLTATLSSAVGDWLTPDVYSEGDVAGSTVYAGQDLLLEDSLSTEQKRSEAAAAVKAVFTQDDLRERSYRTMLEGMLSSLKGLLDAAASQGLGSALSQEARLDFEKQFQINLEGEEWEVIQDKEQWPFLADEGESIVQPVLDKGIIGNRQLVQTAVEKGGAVLRYRSDGHERSLFSGEELLTSSEAEEHVLSAFPSSGFGRGAAFDSLLKKSCLLFLKPNVVFDIQETERRKQAARDAVDPIFTKVRRGEVIVRAGDVVTAVQERKLNLLYEQLSERNFARNVAGHAVIAALILLSVFFFVSSFWPGYKLRTLDLCLVAIALVVSGLILQLFSVLSSALSYSLSGVDADTFRLAAPVAAGGILLQVTIGAPAVLMFLLAFGTLAVVFYESTWLTLLLIISGNTVAALAVNKCSRRSAFIAAGVRTASANVLIVLCYLAIFPKFSTADNAWRLLAGLSGGLFSGILGLGLTPIAEYFGKYITDIKLLELASLDRPLLREVSVQSPGTWNHAMVIGQIGEAAAEEIGANGLLVRVGAYYHDVGKIKKPLYFAENQVDKDNRHDRLTPSMSALIIRSHVKDGIELARSHGLPQAVIDFIPEHHGTSLIEYFYDKALKEADEGETVDETHYRYPGPKPQSRETAIIMLADQIEASSRTLSDPTPPKIQGLVQKIINKVFASGQLDESNLTLRDLHVIARTFTRVLTGIYHRRVEYFEPAEKSREPKGTKEHKEGAANGEGAAERRTNGDAAQQRSADRSPAEAQGGKKGAESSAKKTDSPNRDEALKRLGIS